ncbi:hypothetical protein CAL20_09630 [Bordetella genomosp. 4]|uniref:Uncharacterized protein n=1 Tax=Bordetella genomosp. 4 TaxID=463044 RepID=A0A261U7Z0_9BORD|nr:hypothetical protein CAL20_09630 [Bordetella genomosp. 4]
MTEAEHLLAELVSALDNAFISTWQSTAAWQKQLDAAREYMETCTCPADRMPFGRCCKARQEKDHDR